MKTTLLVMLLFIGSRLTAQATYVPVPEVDSETAVRSNLRVTVPDLPSIAVASDSQPEIVRAAMGIVLNTSCAPGSNVDTIIEAYAGSALGELSSKISGASCLTGSHVQHINSVFTPNREVQADGIISSVNRGRPLLLKWSSDFYVLYGVVYDEHIYRSGRRENIIRKLLLIDPRYSGKQALTFFDRQRDKFADVEGVTALDLKD